MVHRPESLADWLSSGGDHRQVVDPSTGLTPYRVSMAVRDAVPFGSCTASSPGPRAMHAVQRGLHLAQQHGDDAWSTLCDETRATLRRVMELPDDVAIALTPSGTDVLYLVSFLGLKGVSEVHHVVTGASELGGGTLRACRGRTFSDRTPHGNCETVDRPIENLGSACSAEPLYLRQSSGHRLDGDEVDDEIEARVDAAMKEQRRVILHLVAHSKTGLRAPSAECALRLLKRHGNRLLVLVDAAQGRLAPVDVRRALGAGFAVLFTGSKFYSGPPFSGALVLPPSWSADPGPMPEEFSKWFDRGAMPAHWTRARASLRARFNPGLALRWSAARAEFDAYHAIPPRWRGRVYATFAGAVHETFGPSDRLDLEYPLPPVHRLVTALGAFPTVFGFRVRGSSGWMDANRLRTLHAQLDTDASDEDPRLAGQFHLGQPVALGPPGTERRALLRVALSGRLVTDFARTPDAGGAWMRQQMRSICDKIEALIDTDHAP